MNRYLVCLTIAPAFLTAGIYLCLSRIIIVYGEHLARFKPRTYTIIFVCSDIFALVLQAIGGAIADIAKSGSSTQQTGINIMIAGLAFQVVSLSIFIALCLDFAWRVRSRGVSSLPTLRMFDCSPVRMHLFIFGENIFLPTQLDLTLTYHCLSHRHSRNNHLHPILLSCGRAKERF